MAEAVRKPRHARKTKQKIDIEEQLSELPVENHVLEPVLPEILKAEDESPETDSHQPEAPPEETAEASNDFNVTEEVAESNQTGSAGETESTIAENIGPPIEVPPPDEESSVPQINEEEAPASATDFHPQPCVLSPPVTSTASPTKVYPLLPKVTPQEPTDIRVPTYLHPQIIQGTAPQECIYEPPRDQMVESVSSVYRLPPLERVVDDPAPLPQPLSEAHLHRLYQNAFIEQVNRVEDHILQSRDYGDHELYQLLCEYKAALERNNVASLRQKDLVSESKRLQSKVWTLSQETDQQPGRCGDKTKVFATFEYTVAHYHDDMMKAFIESLRHVRDHLDGERSAAMFAEAICKLRIEHYLCQLFTACPRFRNIPVTAPPKVHFGSIPADEIAQIQCFNNCIAVLFAFLRQPLPVKSLVKDIQSWIILLAGALIRTGRSEDHFFLLCQILRAPAGFGSWASNLVQPSIPADLSNDLKQQFFDFTYSIMACILRPIRAREQFLQSFRGGAGDPSQGGGGSKVQESWELVDADGEETEDEHVWLTEGWHRVHESDILALISQIPLSPMYNHLLFSDASQGAVTEASLLRSISCAHQMLRLFEHGVSLYLKKRYSTVVKRLCRLIKHNLQFFTDHMELTMTGMLSDPNQALNAQFVPRVHSQYEQLARDSFEALLCITHYEPYGDHAWQFIAECPFRLLTVPSKRVLLKTLCDRLRRVANRVQDALPNSMMSSTVSETVSTSPNILFVLTTLANLARECRFDLIGERRIIHSAIDEIFELSFLHEELRDAHHKAGRDLLTAILIVHPYLIAYVLDLIHRNMEKLGSVALFMAREMPFHMFIPSMETFTKISDWLINQPAESVSNKLARLILSLLNWGYYDDDPTRLFIPIEFHRHAAILVAQAFKAQTTPKQTHWLIEESSKLVTGMWSSNSPQMAEQCFHLWCMEFIGRLRLHRASSLRYDIQQTPEQCTDHAAVGLPSNATEWLTLTEEQCADIGFALPRDLNVNTSPITLYVALLMTEWGNDIPGKFMEFGLSALELLVTTHYQYRLALEALLKVVQVAGHYNNLLWNNERFRLLLRSLLHGDDTYTRMFKLMFTTDLPCPVLTTLTAMILNCCEESDRFAGWTVNSMCLFWLRCLLGIPNWHQDAFVMHVIEALLTLCYRLRTCMLSHPAERSADDNVYTLFQTIIEDYYQQQIVAASQRTGFSALMNLGAHLPCFYQQICSPSSGTALNVPSQFACSNSTQCTCWPWFTWYMLRAEMHCEEKWGIWSGLQVAICKASKKSNKKRPDIQKCLTKVIKKLKFPLNYALERVSIYLVLKSILRVPVEHPVLPLVVQLFFARFFELPSIRDNLLAGMGSNGIHLFDSCEHSSVLKSLRAHLSQSTSHYRKRLQDIQQQSRLTNDGDQTPSDSGSHPNQRPFNSNSTSSSTQCIRTAGASVGFQRMPLPLLPEGGSFGSRAAPSASDFVVDETQVVWYLAQMMETFVLWLDETRLHTLSLQLEALPSQYNSFRLHQLRTGTYNFWVDLVNPIVLNASLDDLIRPWRRRFVEDDALKRICRTQIMQSRIPTQERLQARFERQEEIKSAPNFTQPSPVVEELATPILRDHIQLSRKVDAHVEKVRQHVRAHVERSSRHGVLDMAIVDFLQRLYVKRKVTDTVQVPCSLGVPVPFMGRARACKAPASIIVKYETFEIRPDIQTASESNRTSWCQVIEEAQQSLLVPLMQSVMTLEDIVNRLCLQNQNANSTNPSSGLFSSLYPQVPYPEYQKCAIGLFYQLTEQFSEEWLSVPLCHSLMSRIMHQIGRVFLQNDATQSQPMLDLILLRGHLTPLIVNHFNPLQADPPTFCHMYTQLVSSQILDSLLQHRPGKTSSATSRVTASATSTDGDSDTVISRIHQYVSILRQFNVEKWLVRSRPDQVNREKLSEVIVVAMQQLKHFLVKHQPGSSSQTATVKETERQQLLQIQEIHMSYLSALLLYEYPSLLPKMTSQLLRATYNDSLNHEVIDIINTALKNDKTATGELSFPIDFIHTILSNIAALLREIDDGVILFTAWSTAFDKIKTLLELLASSLWFKLSRGLQMGQFHPRQTCFDFLTSVWDQTLNFWFLNSVKHQPPSNWDPRQLQPLFDLSQEILIAVFNSFKGPIEMYRGAVLEFAWSWYHGCLMATLMDKMGRSGVSYAAFAGGQMDAFLRLCHSSLLSLPWEWWFPSAGMLLSARQLSSLNIVSINRFIVVLLSKVIWSNILNSAAIQTPPLRDASGEEWNYTDALFYLAVQLTGTSDSVDMPEVSKFVTAITTSDWCSLTAAHYNRAIEWFKEHASSTMILAEPNTVSGSIIKFLRVTAGVSGSDSLCQQHLTSFQTAAVENVMAKQLACIRLEAFMLVHACPSQDGPLLSKSQANLPPTEEVSPQVTAAVHRLLTSVMQAARSVFKLANSSAINNPDHQRSVEAHESALWNECFLLLRNASPGASSRMIIESMCSWLQAVADTDAAASESDAWITLAHVRHMLHNLFRSPPALALVASLTEAVLTPLYLNGKREKNRALDVSEMWQPLATVLVDSFNSRQWEMLELEAVRLNCFLTLRLLIDAHLVTHYRQENCSPTDQTWSNQKTQVVIKALGWIHTVKLKDQDAELHFLPLLRSLLLLVAQESTSAPNAENRLRALRHVQKLLPSIDNFSQDRSGSGLLGKIGLGKLSALSPQFRLLMKCLSTYLLCQCPVSGSSSNQQIRVHASDPGSIPAELSPINSRPPGVLLPSNQAMQAVQKLRQLTGAEYQNLEEVRNYAVRYMTRAENALPQVVPFLDELVAKLYLRPVS